MWTTGRTGAVVAMPRPRLLEENDHGLCELHWLRHVEGSRRTGRELDGWAAYWCDANGGPVPDPFRAATATTWDTLRAPLLDLYESLPPPAHGIARGHNLVRPLWTR